ncbi:MAG TPA: YCF48-related protein, partial [Candidatus Methylomirabilis sp.]|nr:YCF48-related protein [Candidatus Methylomirabilis sp.]
PVDDIQKFADQGPDKPFLDVYFENETTGFIVGAFSLIFRTTDGGKSWTPWYDKIDNPKRFHLYAIRPVGGELYLTAEQGTVFKLDQKAGRFTAIKTPYVGTFFGITGKPGALVAFGMRGNAFRSKDGGASWQKVETGVQGGLMGAAVTEDGRIVLVSQGGHVLVSGDDGASFNQVKIDQATPAAGVAAVGKNTIALVGQRGVQVQTIK